MSETVPAYWSLHWGKSGMPTGSWWAAKDKPSVRDFPEGFFGIYHPEQKLEQTMLPCVVERKHGLAYRMQEINPACYVALGTKLTWRQRLRGIL